MLGFDPRIKPPPGSTVDLGHSLAQGLRGLWLLERPRAFRDLVGSNDLALDASASTVIPPFGGEASYRAGGIHAAGSSGPDVSTNAVTVACWVRPDTLARGDLLTAWQQGAAFSRWNLLYGVTSGKPQFFVTAGISAVGSGVGSGVMSVGRWHHVAGTFNGTRIRVYLDGVLQDETAQTLTLNSTAVGPVRIGDNGFGDGPTTGAVDVPCYWSGELQPGEIAWLAAEPFVLLAPARPPAAYFSFGTGFRPAWIRQASPLGSGVY